MILADDYDEINQRYVCTDKDLEHAMNWLDRIEAAGASRAEVDRATLRVMAIGGRVSPLLRRLAKMGRES